MAKLKKQVRQLQRRVSVLKTMLRNNTADLLDELGIEGEILPDGRVRLEDGRIVGNSSEIIESSLVGTRNDAARSMRLHAIEASVPITNDVLSTEANRRLLHDQRAEFQKKVEKGKNKLAAIELLLEKERRAHQSTQADYINEIDRLNDSVKQLSHSLNEQASVYETKMAETQRSHEENIKEFVNNQLSLRVHRKARADGSAYGKNQVGLIQGRIESRDYNENIWAHDDNIDDVTQKQNKHSLRLTVKAFENEEEDFNNEEKSLLRGRNVATAKKTHHLAPPILTTSRLRHTNGGTRIGRTSRQRDSSIVSQQNTIEHMKQQFDHWMHKRSHEISTFVEQFNRFYAYKKRQVQEYRTEISQMYAHCNRLTNIIQGFQKGRYNQQDFSGLHPIAAISLDSASAAFDDIKRLKYLQQQIKIASQSSHANHTQFSGNNVSNPQASKTQTEDSLKGTNHSFKSNSVKARRSGTVATIHRLRGPTMSS